MVHIGLDMHKRFSEVAVLDDAGAVVDRCRLDHEDQERMRQYFELFEGAGTVTLEATRNWYWLYELLESCGLDVRLAHPLKVRLIAEARVKTDAIDARVLAQLERTGFLPEAYIPPREIRDARELLRYRLSLVWQRTGLKNRVHALLDKLGIGHHFTDLFGTAGRRFLETVELRAVYRETLDGYLAAIAYLDEAVKRVTRGMRKRLQADSRAELLLTIPGVGHLTAYLLLCEIGDVGRFSSAKRLCGYSGLVPRTYQSGERCWQGEITRQGNRYLRWAMVEVAYAATAKDASLAAFYSRLRLKKGAARARVAVARKLLVAVYHVLSRNEPYRYNVLARPVTYPGKPVPPAGRSE